MCFHPFRGHLKEPAVASNKPAIKRISRFDTPIWLDNAVKQPFRILNQMVNAIIGSAPTMGNSLYNCDALIAYIIHRTYINGNVAGIPK